MSGTTLAPAEVEVERPGEGEDVERDVPWIVIVWNDPINLMSYVTLVLQKLFGYSKARATTLMLQVHNEGKAVVGIVEVIREYYPDHTDETGRFGMVDVKAVKPLARPVTLEAIKAEERLAKMILVTNSRLSVQPVTDEEWDIVCRMGGL